MAITVAFDRGVQGWTSEFSFNQMNAGISLNNNYYTFFQGEIWRHNEPNNLPTVQRNQFYGRTEPTEIQFIFNEEPSTVKNFKTLNFEGNGSWNVEMETNTESGSITSAQFVDKEGKQYAYIRGDENQFGTLDLKSANVKGAGMFTFADDQGVSAGAGTFTLDNVPSSLSEGDIIYRSTITGTTGGTPELVGRIDDVTGNVITLDSSSISRAADGSVRTFFTPTSNDLCLYVKSGVAEKSGLIGFFAIVTMTTSDQAEAELFSVATEAFVSS